jgi:hypothetical protein
LRASDCGVDIAFRSKEPGIVSGVIIRDRAIGSTIYRSRSVRRRGASLLPRFRGVENGATCRIGRGRSCKMQPAEAVVRGAPPDLQEPRLAIPTFCKIGGPPGPDARGAGPAWSLLSRKAMHTRRVSDEREDALAQLRSETFDAKRLASFRRALGSALIIVGTPVIVLGHSVDPTIRRVLTVLAFVWLALVLPMVRLLCFEWQLRRRIDRLLAFLDRPNAADDRRPAPRREVSAQRVR